jgi:hypothetical protein
MTSPRPLGSVPDLQIERVEIRTEAPGTLLVRCRGRGGPGGRASLTLRTPAGIRRFPALPTPSEPGDGAWRMAFSVPDEHLDALADAARLEVGGVSVALPAPVADQVGSGPPMAPAVLAERRAAVQTERADEAEARATGLADRLARAEARLAEAVAESRTERDRLAEFERDLEVARQLSFAEGRRRVELEGETTARIRELEAERDALRAQLRAAEQARDELRGRLLALHHRRERRGRRGGAQPAHDPEQPGDGREAVAAGPADPAVLRRERELAALAGSTDGATAPPAAVAEPVEPVEAVEQVEVVELGEAVELGDAAAEPVDVVVAEAVEAPGAEPGEPRLHAVAPLEPAAPIDGAERVADVPAATERPGSPTDLSAQPSAQPDPARLDAARARLRAAVPDFGAAAPKGLPGPIRPLADAPLALARRWREGLSARLRTRRARRRARRAAASARRPGSGA